VIAEDEDRASSEVGLLDGLGEDELPEGVRLRIALDLLEQLSIESAQPVGARAATSRLKLGNVCIRSDGSADIRGKGDSSGAPVLLWEILAMRQAPAGVLPRVHDVVDEIHPDVDDVVTYAVVDRRYATLDELLEALVEASSDRVGTRSDVAGAFGFAPPTPPEKPLAVEPSPLPEAPRQSETRLTKQQEPAAAPAVARSSVLFVAGDPDAGGVREAIERAGHRVILCDAARALETAIAEDPSCIVFDLASSPNALEVIQRMRTDDSTASAIPLLLLTEGEGEPHLGGYLVGGDVCFKKPLRVADMVIQVEALVRMSARLKAARAWLRSRPVQKVFEGNLAHFSVATLLSVLEMERRTGVFEVTYRNRRAELDFIAGVVIRGTSQGIAVPVLRALTTMLEWKKGRFSFTPMPYREPPPGGVGIGELLLEALRRKDEQQRLETEPGRESSAG